VWIRADGRLPDDLLLHHCVMAYASDMTLLDTTTLPHALSWWDQNVQMASLDHAMWFHRPFRADEWLLYAQESPSASGARGFATGSFFTRDGRLVASVAQEGLIRLRAKK
jgi:acyl-CoA thioesterase-2